MYKILSVKLVDFTDQQTGRSIKGYSVYVQSFENTSEYVTFGIEPVKIFLSDNVQLPPLSADKKYELVYDLFGSKPKVIGIREVK